MGLLCSSRVRRGGVDSWMQAGWDMVVLLLAAVSTKLLVRGTMQFMDASAVFQWSALAGHSNCIFL